MFTKTWQEVKLREGEGYRLTAKYSGVPAGSYGPVVTWLPVLPTRINSLIRLHLEQQQLRVGNTTVFDREVGQWKASDLEKDALRLAWEALEPFKTTHEEDYLPTIWVPKVQFGGKKKNTVLLLPVPELTVEADPLNGGSRVVCMRVQVPLVPSVVLPVVDALSWDVPGGVHKVVVYLEKQDRALRPDLFNAAAVVAFARTRHMEEMTVAADGHFTDTMLRAGDWLSRLRKVVGEKGSWALKHACTMPHR